MPRNLVVPVDPETGSELTAHDTAFCRVQNTGLNTLMIVAAVGSAPPDFDQAPIYVEKGQAVFIDIPKFWPGIVDANRLHASCQTIRGAASVSHA